MSFNPVKVSLMVFAVLFKILSAYCGHFSAMFQKRNFGSLMIDVFFQQILNCIMYNCIMKAVKSLEVLVWVRGMFCAESTAFVAKNQLG